MNQGLARLDVPPAALLAIRDLALVARVTVEGTLLGLHRSPFHGYSAEFSEYRVYRPGDDLRYVDWKLFARTDRLFTKRFRETTDVALHLVVDCSGSMGFASDGVVKLRYAAGFAAALAWLAAGQGDAVGLVGYADRVTTAVPARRGRHQLARVVRMLSELEAHGSTDGAGGLRRAVDSLRRRSAIVVLTDAYDAGEAWYRELRRAVQAGHDVAAIHLVSPDETEWRFRGRLRVEDLETGVRLDLDASDQAASYRQRLATFTGEVRAALTRAGVHYQRVSTATPLSRALRHWLVERGRSRATTVR